MLDDCKIIEEDLGFALIEDTTKDKYTVVRLDREDRQVRSAMPTDGSFFSNINDKGIRYVAGFYSKGYARRNYRKLMSQARAMRIA